MTSNPHCPLQADFADDCLVCLSTTGASAIYTLFLGDLPVD